MKKWLIIAIIAFLVLDVAIYLIVKNKKKNSSNQQGAAATTLKAKKKKGGDFMWGIMIRPNELVEYDETSQKKYWDYLDQLNVNWVRMQYSPQDPATFDRNYQKVTEKGIETMTIIPPEIGKKDESANIDPLLVEQKTAELAKKYAGKITYYQIGSELGNFALNGPLFAGIKESDYSETKYQNILAWVKAMAKGIREGDPRAKILLSINRTHFGILDKFVKNNVEFDAIGISWYSGYGENLSDVFSGDPAFQHFDAIEKAKSYNKTIIFSEVTQRFGSKMKNKEGGVEQQSEFLTDFFTQVKKYPEIKGVFVYEFIDGITPPGFVNLDDETHYGLIPHTKNGTQWTLDDPNKTYYTYADIIKNNR